MKTLAYLACLIAVLMLAAPVSGVLGDRVPRRLLVGAGVQLWSLATAAAGAAPAAGTDATENSDSATMRYVLIIISRNGHGSCFDHVTSRALRSLRSRSPKESRPKRRGWITAEVAMPSASRAAACAAVAADSASATRCTA